MRREVIETQKRDHGRKVLAVLPIHYPKEILTALDILAVELWGPPGPPVGPEAGRVQSYVCAVVRNATAFLKSAKAEPVDGVLVPHTCDSLQGLATLLPDFAEFRKPLFRFQHARGADRPSARRYLRSELTELARALEAFAGRALVPERLGWAIDLHTRIDALRGELLTRRGHLALSDFDFYTLLRRGEFLWPEDHLAELEQTRTLLRPAVVQTKTPIAITGYVPEPMSIFSVLEAAGAYVAVDDYAAVGRRVSPSKTVAKDPFDAVVDRLFASPPCPTRTADELVRVSYLEGLLGQSGVRGLIVHEQKFCEPELFDVPALRRMASSRRLPFLYLEGELERELSGQTLTRIEAFIEMVSSGSGRTAA